MIQSLNDESIHYRGNINVKGKDIKMQLANTVKSNYIKTYKNISVKAKGITGDLNMMRPVA